MMLGVTIHTSNNLVARHHSVVRLQMLEDAEDRLVDVGVFGALELADLAGVELVFVAFEHFPDPAVFVCNLSVNLLVYHLDVSVHVAGGVAAVRNVSVAQFALGLSSAQLLEVGPYPASVSLLVGALYNTPVIIVLVCDFFCLHSVGCLHFSKVQDRVHLPLAPHFDLVDVRMASTDVAVHIVGVATLDRQHDVADVTAEDDGAQLVEVFPHPAAFPGLMITFIFPLPWDEDILHICWFTVRQSDGLFANNLLRRPFADLTQDHRLSLLRTVFIENI